MSTTPIRCPECGEFIRVAVQPSVIKWTGNTKVQLTVMFDEQRVAHTCKEKK